MDTETESLWIVLGLSSIKTGLSPTTFRACIQVLGCTTWVDLPYKNRLVILCHNTLSMIQADHSLAIHVYGYRLTIVWTIYDFLAAHGKIIYEILHD